jgi:dipeptidyl aminopeptidase/acylaminoacyl peptidase
MEIACSSSSSTVRRRGYGPRVRTFALAGTLAIALVAGCGGGGTSPGESTPANGPGGAVGRFVTSSDATLEAIPAGGGTPRSVGPRESFFFISRPSVSPDGMTIAFGAQACAACKAALAVASRSGGPALRLYAGGAEPDWSRNGRWIAFIYATPNGARKGLLVYLIDRDGRHPREVEINEEEGEAGHTAAPVYHQPTFSPNGRLLAFVAETEPREVDQIFVLDLAAREVRQLTRGSRSAVDPAFAPDGRTLAYACETSSGSHDICLVDVSGGHASTLVRTAGNDRNPAFSPSAATIVFESDLADRTNAFRSLFSASRTRHGLRRLTSGFDASQPTFTPDGRQVVFVRRSIVKP